jgi:hypothetical protein
MFLAAIVAILNSVAFLRWMILAWLVAYILRSKHAIYGDRGGAASCAASVSPAAYTVLMANGALAAHFPCHSVVLMGHWQKGEGPSGVCSALLQSLVWEGPTTAKSDLLAR